MEFSEFNHLDEALRSRNILTSKQTFLDLCSKYPQNVGLIKVHFELQLRDEALKASSKEASIGEVQSLLDFIVSLTREDLCVKALTVTVLQDILEVSSKPKCEELFTVVEDMVSTWKTPFFFDSCKNSILRMCNDLLKRLSQIVDTAFCGRILILLAKALPLNERSGLNLMSQINTSNVTSYDEDVEMKGEADDEMELGEINESKDLKIDHDLYIKFWKLQSFFVSPNQAYDADKWLSFQSDLTDVLLVLSTYKLERPRNEETSKPQKQKAFSGNASGMANGVQEQHDDEFNSFSAKYLTNQKLFNLQIADSQFRRYFLTQCLIFGSYLTTPNIKSRDITLFLTPAQEKTISGWVETCYQLLRETYPHGSYFADSIKKLLRVDKLWSDWKNDACPDLVSEIKPMKLVGYKRKEIEPYNPDVVDLGNVELTRLWNINKDNLSSCKSHDRIFDEVFGQTLGDVLEEIDPAQQVEEQYMRVNDEKFQWICSRNLLSDNYLHYSSGAHAVDSTFDFVSISSHMKKSILRTAANTEELKDRASEIEIRLAEEAAKKKAEQDAQVKQAELDRKAELSKRLAEEKLAAEKKASAESKSEQKKPGVQNKPAAEEERASVQSKTVEEEKASDKTLDKTLDKISDKTEETKAERKKEEKPKEASTKRKEQQQDKERVDRKRHSQNHHRDKSRDKEEHGKRDVKKDDDLGNELIKKKKIRLDRSRNR